MVIKVRSIINKIISIGVCVLLSFSVYKKCSQELHAPHEVVVQTDSLLSEQTSCSLATFIKNNTQPLESALFSQLLFSQFPCVTSYELEKNPSGLFSCMIESAQPILSINNTWALTNDGRIALLTDFSSVITQSLHNVTMPQFLVTDSFRSCMHNLSPDLFQAYSVVWLNDQEALLCDRMQPFFSIRFNADSIPQASTLKACAAIKNDLEQRGVFACPSGKKKPQQWIADIRFKNQIVVSWNAGGTSYG